MLDCFLTSSEGPSTSAPNTSTHSNSDSNGKQQDDEMNNATSNEDLEIRDDEQSQGTSDDECTEDEGRMSIEESDKESEQKWQKRIGIIGRLELIFISVHWA